MLAAPFDISPQELWRLLGTPDAPQVVDVRRREFYDAGPGAPPLAALLRFAADERHDWRAKVA